MIRIVTTGGTTHHTKVYQGDVEITDVSRIVIEPLEVDGLVLATVTTLCELDIEARDTLVLSGADID